MQVFAISQTWLVVLVLIANKALVARRCFSDSLVRGVAYGDPHYGCCHYAKLAAVLCSPTGPSVNDTVKGEAECAKDAYAAPRVNLQWSGPSTAEACEEECMKERDCKIWSFREAKKAGAIFLPGVCRLIKENLMCAPNTCKSSSAVLGSKDCDPLQYILTETSDEDDSMDISGDIAKPWCDMPSAEPPVRGTMKISGVSAFLELEAGCRHRIWDPPSVEACHKGTWVVVVGGSNSILQSIHFANNLAPATFHPARGSRTGDAHISDAVIEDGVRTHRRAKTIVSFDESDWTKHKDKFLKELNRAPTYKSNAIRITHFVGQYWTNVDTVLELLRENVAWQEALEKNLVTIFTQISQWYLVCGVYNLFFCNRKEIRGEGRAKTQALFKEEMLASMGRLSDFCKPGGPAGKLGCSISSNAYDPGQGGMIAPFNDIIHEIVKQFKTPYLRFVDIWTLGASAPTETIKAHNTPMIQAWIWQIVYGSTCTLAGFRPTRDVAWMHFQGDTCFEKQVSSSLEECPDYRNECGSRCDRWECAHGPLCRALPDMGISSTNSTDSAGPTLERRCWSKRLNGMHFLEVHDDACYDFGVAVKRCELTPDCHAINTQNDICGGKYRISRGDPIWRNFTDWEAYQVGAYSLDRECLTGGIKQEREKDAINICKTMPEVHFYSDDDFEAAASKVCERVTCDESLEVVFPILGGLAIIGAFCASMYTRYHKSDGIHQAAEKRSTSQVVDVGNLPASDTAAREEQVESPEIRVPVEAGAYESLRCKPTASTLGSCVHVQDVEESIEQQDSLWPSKQEKTNGISETLQDDSTTGTLQLNVIDQATEVRMDKKSEPREGSAAGMCEESTTDTSRANGSVDDVEGDVDHTRNPQNGTTPESPGSKSRSTAASRASTASRWSVTAVDGRFPLGLSRYIASLHIVAGHLYQGGHIAEVYLYSWGFTWVPWFFMLSGFVLFSANAKRPTEENAFEYVRRRSVTIWPLYAISLFIMFILSKSVYSYSGTPGGGYLVAQTLLVQSWVPWLTENTLQLHCWFLSCMVVYWLCFKPLYKCVSGLSMRATFLCVAVTFVLPWIAAVIIPGAAGDAEWYKAHKTLKTDSVTDIAVVIFKFHPLSYFHVFVCGMLVAHLRRQLGTVDAAFLPYAFHLLAPVSYILLLIIFTVEPIKPWGFKLSARLSILLPLQAGVLLGMAGLPMRPLPILAALASKVEFLADYSYAVYIFQFFCKKLWPTPDLNGPGATIGFYVFLMGTAAAAVHLVQRPAQNAWKKLPWKATVAIPIVLAIVLFALSFIDDKDKWRYSYSDLPEVKDHGGGKIDWRLGLNLDSKGTDALINPSVAVMGDQLIVAARQHSREWKTELGVYRGEDVTIMSQIWHSDIVIGQATLDDSWASGQNVTLRKWSALWKQLPWGSTCVIETYLPENKTLLRKVVTGPEDPRLMFHGGESGHDHLALSFNSMPPLGMHGCAKGYAVSQMYLAPVVSTEASTAPALAHRIQCGLTRVDEKNWIPFSRTGRMHFVYTPQPHRVAVVREDGACQILYTSSFPPLQKLVNAHQDWRVRGSAQAVYINSSRMISMPKPHYLALLHIFDVTTGKYAHYAYRFNPHPPFEIWQLSHELRLETIRDDIGGVSFAFVTGLAVQHNRNIIITYGAGDREARALVMPLERFEADYFSSNCAS